MITICSDCEYFRNSPSSIPHVGHCKIKNFDEVHPDSLCTEFIPTLRCLVQLILLKIGIMKNR